MNRATWWAALPSAAAPSHLLPSAWIVQLMKNELGLDGEDAGDEHGRFVASCWPLRAESTLTPGPPPPRCSDDDAHSDGDAAGGATASFARSAGGGGGGTFGSAKTRGAADAQATSYSGSGGGGVPLAVYRALQEEKLALAETVRELQEKVLQHGATSKQTVALLRKALQTRLQTTLAELAVGVEELENKLKGPGSTGGGHVSQKIQDAIAVQVGGSCGC